MSTSSVAVMAVNLDTGERRAFPSMTAAASWCMVDVCTVRKSVHADSSYHGWYWVRIGQEADKEEKIQQLMRRWIATEKPIYRAPCSRSDLHPLRLDAHTVIYVTKDKCNEKYAETYRNKLKNRKIHHD